MSFRQATRLVLVDTCIIAAQHARRRGEPEPFMRGCPTLRRALALLGIPQPNDMTGKDLRTMG